MTRNQEKKRALAIIQAHNARQLATLQPLTIPKRYARGWKYYQTRKHVKSLSYWLTGGIIHQI